MTAIDPRPPRTTPPGARRGLRAASGLLLTAALLATAGCVAGAGAEAGSPPGQEGGAVPDDPRLRDDRVDPLDDAHPSIAGLRSEVREALQAAARDAEARGVELWVTSGRRSSSYQQELLEQAVHRHGSLAEARRFVAPPDTSSHVSGDAVDIGPTDAADWMIRNGADHGLCQTYGNEMWHFELATDPGGTCPAPRPDAAG